MARTDLERKGRSTRSQKRTTRTSPQEIDAAGMSPEQDRSASIERRTAETSIKLELCLDGRGEHQIESGIGFLDHMLAQLAFHGLFDIRLTCHGDLHIDSHHTTEDCALVLGEGFDRALGDRQGIRRFSHCIYPMDEALVRVALDFSGRPLCRFSGTFTANHLGTLATQMIPHFFISLASAARMTLHAAILEGENDHHKAEGLFKALARALHDAVAIDPRRGPHASSTKGRL